MINDQFTIHNYFLNNFPHFFFRKRNLEERKLSHEEMWRQTAHSFTKIYTACPRLLAGTTFQNFLTFNSWQICIGAFLSAKVGCGMQNSVFYLFHDFIFWPICSESESEFLDIEYLSKNVAKRKIMKQARARQKRY
jgi:hypothetical protein